MMQMIMVMITVVHATSYNVQNRNSAKVRYLIKSGCCKSCVTEVGVVSYDLDHTNGCVERIKQQIEGLFMIYYF